PMRGQLASLVIFSKSARNRVSGPQLMAGWESRINRKRVVPERWQPTTKIGGPDMAGDPRAEGVGAAEGSGLVMACGSLRRSAVGRATQGTGIGPGAEG